MLGLDDGAAAAQLRASSSPTCRRTRPALNPALRIGKQILEVLEAHDFGGSDGRPADRVPR